MAKIEGIRIANYRVLKNLILGKLWNTQGVQPLTPMSVVTGKNGVGKSSLFDAFGFLADCLRLGVEEACDARGRGGFRRIRSQGAEAPIEFEVYYREEPRARPITYELAIDTDDSGRPYVARERLRQRRQGQSRGRPFSFLLMNNGRGVAWARNAGGERIDESRGAESVLETLIRSIEKRPAGHESADTEIVELEDKRKLGIATLGALKRHPMISSFRRFVEGWYLSYFTPDAARGLPLAGPQKHLNVHGDNLGNVVQFMEREQPERFKGILSRIAGRIPGIDRIDTEQSPDGRLLLRFNDKGFDDPFYAQQMSDGTLKVFAYLVMLEDPQPPPVHLHRGAGERPVPQVAGDSGRGASGACHGKEERAADIRHDAPAVFRRRVAAGRNVDSGEAGGRLRRNLPGRRRRGGQLDGNGGVAARRPVVQRVSGSEVAECASRYWWRTSPAASRWMSCWRRFSARMARIIPGDCTATRESGGYPRIFTQ